ncbi:MAG TPA: L,D-transpeptidase, partial [Actinomycetota bacterium]|nr:L,D-transpeptidase [Actinomycetota bacterium]
SQGALQLPLLPPIPLPAGMPDINLSTLLPNLAPSPPAPPSAPQGTPAQAAPPPSNPDNAPASSTVADAAVGTVPYYGSPGGGQEGTLPGHNVLGETESFLVVGSQPGWYDVEIPVKPNGSTAWIRSSAVTTRADPYAIVVHQGSFTLNLYENGSLLHSYRVAVGAPSTPTPNGNFYVLVSQAYNQAPYAVGIFGLSVFSNVLQDWAGGGEIGIHGWQDTSVLGHQASHGCVRMSGADFQVLYNSVPLGTPVAIEAQ